MFNETGQIPILFAVPCIDLSTNSVRNTLRMIKICAHKLEMTTSPTQLHNVKKKCLNRTQVSTFWSECTIEARTEAANCQIMIYFLSEFLLNLDFIAVTINEQPEKK